MPTSARADARLTVDDYMRFPDDGKRHEIIDGRHYVTPSPNLRHQAIGAVLTTPIVPGFSLTLQALFNEPR